MVDRPFRIDATEDYVYLVLGAAVLLVLTVQFTTLDAHARFLVTDTSAYFSSPSGDSLQFTRGQVDNLNWASQLSVGTNVVADERLYCGSVTNLQVTELRLVDDIRESTLTSVSGACTDRFGDINLFVHSQPGGSSELSEEDRNVESPGIDYSCIQSGEIAVSPVNQRVSGLDCWTVEGTDTDAEFTPIPVTVLNP